MNILLIAGLTVFLILAIVIANKFRNIKTISPIDFVRRVRNGVKFRDIEPAALQEILAQQNNHPLLVDLREKNVYEKGHIANAISLPFDDFMHEILVNEKYGKDEEMILICDHGHKSKVAADILGEDEGFSAVFSVRGGMEAWNEHVNINIRSTHVLRCCS